MAEKQILGIELTPEARQLLRDLRDAPATLPVKVARAMDYQNALTVSHIQRAYLSFPKSGPPVDIGLRVQSNRLRGAAWFTPATASGTQVESAIGDNVEYAAIHEFGGTIRIKAHKRTLRFAAVRGRMLKQPKNNNLLVFAKANRKSAVEKEVTIGERTVTMPERMPFRRGIMDRMPNYGKAISKAVMEALSGTQGPQGMQA